MNAIKPAHCPADFKTSNGLTFYSPVETVDNVCPQLAELLGKRFEFSHFRQQLTPSLGYVRVPVYKEIER